MKPPSKIKVGPRDYAIRLLPKMFDQMADSPGLADPDKRLILLAESTPEPVQRETLLHELTHQLLHLAGLTTAHDDLSADIDRELEERICIRVAPVLLGLLRENPRLVTYLTGKD